MIELANKPWIVCSWFHIIFKVLWGFRLNHFRILLLLLVLALSCSSSYETTNLTPIKTIEVDENQEDQILLSSYVEDINYVKLDSIEGDYVSSVDAIRFYENNLLILDKKKQKIFAFNLKGNFLFKVASQGPGPEEYGRIDFFDYNPLSKTIDIYNTRQGKIIQYDLTDKYYGNIRVNLIARDFIITAKGEYLFYSPDEPNELDGTSDLAGLILVNSDGTEKEIIGAYGDQAYTPYVTPNPLIHDNERILLVSNYSDTIYQFANSNLAKQAFLNFDKKMPKDILYRTLQSSELGNLDFPFWKIQPLSTQSFWGFTFSFKGKAKYFLQDKVNDSTLVSSHVINDIDGGFPVLPEAVQVNNNQIALVVSQRNIDQLEYHIRNNKNYLGEDGYKTSDILMDIQNHIITLDGTPVLIIGNLK